MTICQTSVAPSTMPRIVHSSSSARVPRNTSREPATLVTLSKILNDLVFCTSLWNRDGEMGICGGAGGLYCGREDDEDAEDMIGMLSPQQGDEFGRSCEGAETSIVEWSGGLHLALFNRRHLFRKLSILMRRTGCNRESVNSIAGKERFSCRREGDKDHNEIILDQKSN
jgi:hypothetical protein